MCRGKAFICRRFEQVPDYSKITNDHEPIISRLNLDDTRSHRNFVRIEMLPCGNLFSTSRDDWEFTVDEYDPPEWFSSDIVLWKDRCYNTLFEIIIPDWIKHKTIVGSLNLTDTKIKSLPRGLTIIGDLLLIQCKDIDRLPQKLNVTGYCSLSNSSIRHIPRNVKFGGTVDLENTPISKLPDNITIGGSLLCNNCGNLKRLPKHMSITEDLSIMHTKITRLPKSLYVGVVFSTNDNINKDHRSYEFKRHLENW